MVGRSRKGPVRRRRNMGKTIIRQVLLCILILLIIVFAKKMDTAVVQSALQGMKAQFAKDITLSGIIDSGKSTFGKLGDGTSFVVASLTKGIKGLEFSPPADVPGSYSASAGETAAGKTLEFQSGQEIQVYASEGGTVSQIGTDAWGNKYIKIYHGNEMTSLYGGCTQVYVETLEKVKRGQIIGTVAAGDDQTLRFEIWNDGKLADPSDYISF